MRKKNFKRASAGRSDRRESKRSGREDSGRFSRRSSGRFSRDREDSDRPNRRGPSRFSRFRESERPRMHEVTCDQCGSRCEVPFKPTSNKPVYCSDCFKKDEKPSSSNSNLDEINKKLDKIIKLLGK